MRVTLTVNGTRRELDLAPRRTLADALRAECGLASVHHGCTDGTCGACTVLVGGEAVRSCLMLGVQCHGAHVRTVEGLADDHPLQAAAARRGAAACEHCLPGYVMLAVGALAQDPDAAADPERLRRLFTGNACGCGAEEANHEVVIGHLLAAGDARTPRGHGQSPPGDPGGRARP